MILINNYYIYLVLIIILSAGSSISGANGYLLLIEIVSSNKRSVYGSIINSSLPIGALMFLTLIYTVEKINTIFIIIGCSFLLTAILICLYCSDSPRIIMSEIILNKAIDHIYLCISKTL